MQNPGSCLDSLHKPALCQPVEPQTLQLYTQHDLCYNEGRRDVPTKALQLQNALS